MSDIDANSIAYFKLGASNSEKDNLKIEELRKNMFIIQ